jgi:glycosyltransferase involved in cell wall biosynthesis
MKIFVITDVAPNRNGFASPQTLFNFLNILRAECFILAEKNQIKQNGIDANYKNKFITYTNTWPWQWKNRFEIWSTPIRNYINRKYFKSYKKQLDKCISFKPDCILVVPNSINCILFANNFLKKLSISKFCYFMDDYAYYNNYSNLIQVKSLMRKCNGAIFIGNKLACTFINEYRLNQNYPHIIAHNPVDFTKYILPRKVTAVENIFSFVYAGSIYPNHKDSLILFIKAITLLNEKGIKCRLTIYTQQLFWENLLIDLDSYDIVNYGGQIMYDELHLKLNEYQFGVVTESHLDDLKVMASSSIQTKINDYLLSGISILCIGPKYGGCNSLLRSNQIGHCFTEINANILSGQLFKFLMNTDIIEKSLNNSFHYLYENYNQQKYQKRVIDFLNEA